MKTELLKCPCCGGPMMVPADISEMAVALSLGPIEHAIFRIITRGMPFGVNTERLIAGVYGDRETEHARVSIAVIMRNLRKKLNSIGWDIPKQKGGRSVEAVYRLERLK